MTLRTVLMIGALCSQTFAASAQSDKGAIGVDERIAVATAAQSICRGNDVVQVISPDGDILIDNLKVRVSKGKNRVFISQPNKNIGSLEISDYNDYTRCVKEVTSMLLPELASPEDTRLRDIKLIQRALYNKDCYKGDIDGIWGPETMRAIEQFNIKNITNLSLSAPNTYTLEVVMSNMSFYCEENPVKCFTFNGSYICE